MPAMSSRNAGGHRHGAVVASAITLGANVDNLTLTGSADIDGTGNGDVNAIIGDGGNNTLDGGAGADTMTGGAGNDTYVVDNVGDVVVEDASEGIDTVRTSVSYTLTANVENLMLTGTAHQWQRQRLRQLDHRQRGDNTLDGGAGADTMIGGRQRHLRRRQRRRRGRWSSPTRARIPSIPRSATRSGPMSRT